MTNNRTVGTRYEILAADYLRSKGYEILDMNYHTRFAELDIIALNEDALVFVEVKYRRSTKQGYPSEAVDFRKQGRIRKASVFYMTEKGYSIDDTFIRYDIISILGKDLEHLENAF